MGPGFFQARSGEDVNPLHHTPEMIGKTRGFRRVVNISRGIARKKRIPATTNQLGLGFRLKFSISDFVETDETVACTLGGNYSVKICG